MNPQGQSGSAVAEAVIVVPVFMVVVILAIQFALWAHADHIVQSAAARGEEVARQLGSTAGAGQAAAERFLAATAPGLVTGTVVSETIAGDQAVVEVTGDARAILPFFTLPVRATSIGPVQEFRTSG